MARKFDVRPSEILGLSGPVITEDWDPYTAYCLDEAILAIELELDDDKKPKFNEKVKSMKDFYKGILSA